MQKRHSAALGRSTGCAAAVMIGVSFLFLSANRVQAQPIIDQQNTMGGSVSFGSTGAGQSFTPSLPGVCFATFSLSTPSVSDTLRLDVFDGSGFGGTLLASSALVAVNTGTALQPIEFDFSSTIGLTPGNSYTLHVELTAGTTYGAEFSSSNPYTGGVGFASNGVPNPANDFVFSEGLNVVREPSAFALSALCGIGLAGGRKIRNYFWPPKGLLTPFLPLMAMGLVLAYAPRARAQFVNQVLGDNPQGFWILNDAPGSPATAVDSSVNGFNGTYQSGVTPQGIAGPSWVPASGLVASFNGSGNISFPAPLNLGANGYSIEAWINPTLASLQNTSRVVASGRGVDGYGFGTAAGGQLIFSTFAQQDYETTLTVPLLPNQWYYVGVVLDASNDASFYVNGALRQTVTGTPPTNPPTLDFSIGSRSPPLADEFFTGGLAGISVYGTALTASQIQDQFNAAAVPEPSSLVLTGLAALGAGRALWRRRSKASISVPQ